MRCVSLPRTTGVHFRLERAWPAEREVIRLELEVPAPCVVKPAIAIGRTGVPVTLPDVLRARVWRSRVNQ
ncbi:hypothetical protein PUN4_180036 [Paraburkholderia unamae]|nr:hypothetical protein PUN4_180036 [Paraburkholderia unamae]